MAKPVNRSTVCVSCGKLISSEAEYCPFCHVPQSRIRRAGRQLRFDPTIDTLIRYGIGVHVLFFLISLVVSGGMPGTGGGIFQLFAPKGGTLLAMGATGTVPIDRFGRWWSLLTAGFLHGGLIHLLFNMTACYQLAPLIFSTFGRYRGILLFIGTSVTGFYLSYLAGIQFTIGASAALCGWIGAAVFYGRSRGGMYGMAVYRQAGSWAVSILIFGFLFPGINNWGHIGGFIGGVMLASLLGYDARTPEQPWHRYAALASLVATFGFLGVGLVSAVQ